eukprot:4038549-Pleurochrysis_carterae.AAC.1
MSVHVYRFLLSPEYYAALFSFQASPTCYSSTCPLSCWLSHTFVSARSISITRVAPHHHIQRLTSLHFLFRLQSRPAFCLQSLPSNSLRSHCFPPSFAAAATPVAEDPLPVSPSLLSAPSLRLLLFSPVCLVARTPLPNQSYARAHASINQIYTRARAQLCIPSAEARIP